VDGGLVQDRCVRARAGLGRDQAECHHGERRLELLRSGDDERCCNGRSGVVIVVVEEAVMIRLVIVEVAMDDRPAGLRGVQMGRRQH
jgi:hypothetical protein